jgi:hypothetical protein
LKMDFSFTPEEEAFQKQVQEFLQKEVTEEVVRETEAHWQMELVQTKQLLRKLGERRWLAPDWPLEYGGMNASYIQRFIIQEEVAYSGGPDALVGVGMAGPIITKFGSEEQKTKYLLPIARGEIDFALGYTEPQAGSDLAALEIKAEDKGDYFLMNGQKLFNTHAHLAQYHWLGARTEVTTPKHRGISLFIVDLNSPGITINPIWCLAERTNEVYYDDVRVPKENLVGEENKGWYYIGEALNLERTWITGRNRRFLDELIAFAKEACHNGKPLVEDPLVRQMLAELAIESEISYLHGYRIAWMLDRGMIPNYEAAMAKLIGSELMAKLAYAGMQIMGLYGQLREDSKWAPLQGKVERRFRDAPRPLVTRGSSEIMRNIIAQRGLGLPRR